ncbi:alkaline phosphatase [Salipaludibacillus sp. CUR1]|uniref:alkaline phosphatase n=1 Tax=Salipaludibacillus sp. CUR1 TaxID=2820003 RepID=UPI001E532874|nr:alkaline phosphatase [Salipaludibacillus sp. CUR1]MCE7792325.1 alkaline phosphatase [Salipaludibacillus sp. CUR1]
MKYSKLMRSAGVLALTASVLMACNNESDEVDASPDNNGENTDQSENSEGTQTAPKNVIMMIGDGMGVGQIEIARLLEHGKEGILHMEKLEHAAFMRTYSSNNWVTDSAAAGTGIATSVKTDNGMLGVDPDGNELDSILKLFQAHDRKVGVISNNTVTDATPAAFTANVESRSGQEEIARQMLENEYDLMLGGGTDYFLPERQDGNNLIEEFEELGYDIVTDRDELLDVENSEKLLGLFHDSFMNYKVDYDLYDSNEPSLNEMSEVALDMLSQDDDGFFLMIEGARIDHAAHAADFTSVWQETIEFDETVGDVMEWAGERDDTLVVVLADHETMGMASSEVMDKEALRNVSASPEYMVSQFEFDEDNGIYTPESVRSVVQEYANFEMTDEEIDAFNEYIYDEEGELRFPHEQGWEIGSFIADQYGAGIMSREIRAASSTGGHTGNMVPVFAEGLGAERFNGTLDNTDITQILAEVSELDFEPGEIPDQTND